MALEYRIEQRNRQTDFQDLSLRALELESPCRCCERRCGAERRKNMTGFCGSSSLPQVTKFFITYGEEPPLNPAYMLYFGHCNLRCRYCSNHEFIQRDFHGGVKFDPDELAAEIDQAFYKGAVKVIQILGGEPSCFLNAAVQLKEHLKSNIPVVWNSNFFFSEEAFDVIGEIADFFVADFKFGNDSCAEKLADAKDYLRVITRNMKLVPRDRLLIRQLPLHGHLECCTRPILHYLSEEFSEIPVSFNELLPPPFPSACRPLNQEEHGRLDELIRQYEIHRIHAVYNSPRTDLPEKKSCFSSEILIKKDGTILLQDASAPLCRLLSKAGLTSK